MAVSAAFYDAALEPLGGRRLMDFGVAAVCQESEAA